MLNRGAARILAVLLVTLAGTPVVNAHSAVPASLSVPDGNVLAFTMAATGVQVYACKARVDNPDDYAWAFVAPDAELLNDAGMKVGTHYAGPTWKSEDGSTVVGAVLEREDAAEPGAIPWLLLRSSTHEGDGIFSRVSYIQRLETVGGVAPAEGCDHAAVGTARAVEYRATYAFFAPHSGDTK